MAESLMISSYLWYKGTSAVSVGSSSFDQYLTKTCGYLVIVEQNNTPWIWEKALDFMTTQ